MRNFSDSDNSTPTSLDTKGKKKCVSGAVYKNIKYGKKKKTYKPKSNFTRSVAEKAFC